jgi:hypothetical protein
MSTIVNVVFDRTRDYELIAHPGTSREAANQWLNAQWEALECEPSNPLGKVLVLDKILNIARYGGEQRFTEPGAWTQAYADAVAAVLERPVVRVDVAERVVG